MKTFKLKSLLAILVLSSISVKSTAGGIPTFDGLNVVQSTISALNTVHQYQKQIQEYRTQLLQYENQLRNSLAPAAYIWAEAQQTMQDLQRTVNALQNLQNQMGGVNEYLKRFKDISYYQNANCYYTPQDCIEEFKEQREIFSKLQNRANEDLYKGIDFQQEQLNRDARKLQNLQSNAQSAQGQMAALQYANQLAAEQSNQILQLRAILLTQMKALNVAQQVSASRQAQIEGATNKLHATGNTMGLRP
ncbi:conjugal transfer protein TrbJ [Phocoenobacter uteri]|uniref:Conjugal transfer protein TrbJ n=1 Tax=Phocoenobacter uteri TaxID=146806 RepID=A0A379DGJ8_9PAST|nr:P-type conjugative transfer protein TrbJ [Phocoenobacter uteri]MDG6882813.1 hypothetical protein [Phocoenobacter uteri]MDG6882852.1 hypothetical protein [Phocoenobacter uteri]SUB76403.1 conjugal transfer protein TrbJ [Phocoenobacter uteri]